MPFVSPALLVSGVSFHSYFVPSGKSPLLEIASSAFGAESFSAVTSLPVGSFLSASV